MTETTTGGTIKDPKSSRKNKTGTWRTFKPNVDKEKCIKCGKCAELCPEGAIKITEEGAKVNMDYCKGCGICAKECPAKAIKMEKEEK